MIIRKEIEIINDSIFLTESYNDEKKKVIITFSEDTYNNCKNNKDTSTYYFDCKKLELDYYINKTENYSKVNDIILSILSLKKLNCNFRLFFDLQFFYSCPITLISRYFDVLVKIYNLMIDNMNFFKTILFNKNIINMSNNGYIVRSYYSNEILINRLVDGYTYINEKDYKEFLSTFEILYNDLKNIVENFDMEKWLNNKSTFTVANKNFIDFIRNLYKKNDYVEISKIANNIVRDSCFALLQKNIYFKISRFFIPINKKYFLRLLYSFDIYRPAFSYIYSTIVSNY